MHYLISDIEFGINLAQSIMIYPLQDREKEFVRQVVFYWEYLGRTSFNEEEQETFMAGLLDSFNKEMKKLNEAQAIQLNKLRLIEEYNVVATCVH